MVRTGVVGMDVQPKALFSEPSGWDSARVSVFSSLAFFSMYVYFELLYGSGSSAILVIGASMALSAVAEMLPPNRRHFAGTLRMIAIGILVILVVFSLRGIVS